MANIIVNGQTILEKVSGAADYKIVANGLPIKEVYSNGTRIYRAFYHYWQFLGYYNGSSYNLFTSGVFCGNVSQMINQITSQFPPNNYSVGTVILVYDECDGELYRFQVSQQYL